MADPVSEDDIIRAIGTLRCLGGGFGLATIGGRTYVRSVPGELDTDKNRAIEVAARDRRGCVGVADLAARAGWSEIRAEDVLRALLREGLALLDCGDPGSQDLYWFPCVE